MPLAPSADGVATFGFMGLVRPWSHRSFSPREAERFRLVSTRSRWLSQQVVFGLRGARREALCASLPAHLQRVHRLLLSGLSEKQMAARLNLSARTVHKYVERLYEAFDVQSRAQLMALWVDRSG